jgi:hypothetical protein
LSLKAYVAIPYKELNDLARRFQCWFKTLKPKSTAVVVSAKDAQMGDVVEVAGAGEAAAAAPPATRVRYSLPFNDGNAGPGAVSALGVAPAAAQPNEADQAGPAVTDGSSLAGA